MNIKTSSIVIALGFLIPCDEKKQLYTHEFRDTAPILAYSGYLFSTSTGVFRMMNDRHWISDVLVGAGIGILATELVYHFEPLKNFNPFKHSKNINFVPQIDQNSYGFYFSYRF